MVVGKILTIIFYVTTGLPIVVQNDAALGATSLVLARGIETALQAADRVRFGNLVVTLTADATIGAKLLTVAALSGALARQSNGKKVQDISGWDIDWTMGTDELVYLHKTTNDDVHITDGSNGVVAVEINRADTYNDAAPPGTEQVMVPAGTYRHALSRYDPGSEALLATGDVELFKTVSV